MIWLGEAWVQALAEPLSVSQESADSEPFARLGEARRRPAVLAGGYPCQRHKLTPSKRRPSGGELFGDGAVILLGVERAVFTDGIAQKQVEDGSGRLVQRADLMNDRASL